jgi:hypothetical protein
VKPPSAIQPESAPEQASAFGPTNENENPGCPISRAPFAREVGIFDRASEASRRGEARPRIVDAPCVGSPLRICRRRSPRLGHLARSKEQTKDLPEDHFLRQQRHCQRKNHSPTTAMNVIAICMMSPCSSLFGRTCLPVSIGQHSYQCKTGTRSYPTENKQVGLGRLGYESVSATTPCLSIHRFCSASGMRIEIKD